MKLKEFKDYIESFPNDKVFEHGISYPFSWRGVYAEVAFDVELHNEMSKEQVLHRINAAYVDTFTGYKGGDFTYNDHTDVHFEESHGRYTDGGYCADIISKLEDQPVYNCQETRLTKLAFK